MGITVQQHTLANKDIITAWVFILYIPPKLNHSNILGVVEIQTAQVAIFDVVEQVLVDSVRGALTLQLKDDHP